MNLLQWIPNFFKGMVEVLKELQQMAGGGIRGQLVFWVSFILGVLLFLTVLALAFNPAYESVSATLSHFNVDISYIEVNVPMGIFANTLLALFVTIISLIFLVGICAAIGALLGMFVNITFGSGFRIKLDEVFSIFIPMLRDAKQKGILDEAGEKILSDAEDLYVRWDKSRINKFVRWRMLKKKKRSK